MISNGVLASTELTPGVRISVMLVLDKSHLRFGILSKSSHLLIHWTPCYNDCFSLMIHYVTMLFVFYFEPILRVCSKTWIHIWNCVVDMISWNNVNWNQYLFFVPFTWCLWNEICWWQLVFTVMGHSWRYLVWQTIEASVSPVGLNGLMVVFHMGHLSFSAGDIV